MAKYARLQDGYYIDVYRVPEDFSDLEALNRCLPIGNFVEVDDGIVSGAKDNGDGTFTNPPPPPPPPTPSGPTKADLMAQIQALLAAVEAMDN